MFHFTTSALNGVPSWKVTPSCSVNTIRLPSGDVSQLLASSGRIEKSGAYFTSVSNTR